MEKPVNLLRGCVRIEAKGAFPENFLNHMAKAGIEFWGAEPVKDFAIRLTVRSSDLQKAEHIAAAALCSVRVLGRKGSTVIVRRLRRRRVLLFCLAVCLLALGASSLFIWDIDVTGNEAVSKGEILRALDDCGVSIGSFWPEFSSDLIRNSMLLKIPELRWMTVNVSQSRAEVIVRERTAKPAIVDNRAPVDIIANRTGIITKMNVLQGRPLFAVGDAVVAGETLVTGVMDSPYGETRYVHAMAEVEAAVWYELSAEAALCDQVKEYTGAEKTHWALLLGDRRINFYRNSGKNGDACDKIIEMYPFARKGLFTLPITFVREDLRAYRLADAERDKKALRESLEAELSSALANELGDGGSVVSASFVASERNGLMIVTLRAECRENISVETPFTP